MAYKDPERRKAYDRERHRKYMNEWRKRKGEGYRTRYRIGQLRRQYGLSEDEFNDMLDRQRGACAACGTAFAEKGPTRLTVDHDHILGRVRGLLCCACNRTVGHSQEKPWRLRACAVYLENWQ